MTESLSLALLGTFESLRMGPTFARGRRAERAGHVRQLTISSSLVVAQVRGPDDPAALRARIAVRSFGAAEWARIERDLVAQARYVADLLAGRMPADIGEIFAAAGLSPVPLALDEVAMDCTCQRWPMPCVHVAATCYALARAFEEDPFEVFAWRGRPRDELLTRLRELRDQHAVAMTSGGRTPPRDPADDVDPADDLESFWGVGVAPLVPTGVGPGSVSRPDALLDQLDAPPLADQSKSIVDLLRPAYRALAR